MEKTSDSRRCEEQNQSAFTGSHKYGSNVTAPDNLIDIECDLETYRNNEELHPFKNVLILPFNLKCIFEITKQGLNVQINGTFCHANGAPLSLGNFFSSSDLTSFLSEYFFISPTTKVLQYLINVPVTDSQCSQLEMVNNKVADLFMRNQQALRKILIITGNLKAYCPTSKKLRKLKLIAREKLENFLNHAEGECCVRELAQEQKNKDNSFEACIKEFMKIKFSKEDKKLKILRKSESSNQSAIYRINPILNLNGEEQKKMLALKRTTEINGQNAKKLIKEKRILKQLKAAPYLLNYYHKETDHNNLFMDYIPDSLHEKYSKNSLSILQKISIMKQVTHAIIQIHEQGIVHRDLKPNNILIEEISENNQKYYKPKIIDFGQSIQCWKQINKQKVKQQDFEKLGATLPYSPIQCSVLCPDGYSKLKIDNWSIGVLLSEAMIGRIPINYTKSQKENIRSGWISSDFNYLMNLRIKEPLGFITFALKVLSLSLMKFKYRERLCLQPVYEALNFFSEFTLKNILEK